MLVHKELHSPGGLLHCVAVQFGKVLWVLSTPVTEIVFDYIDYFVDVCADSRGCDQLQKLLTFEVDSWDYIPGGPGTTYLGGCVWCLERTIFGSQLRI